MNTQSLILNTYSKKYLGLLLVIIICSIVLIGCNWPVRQQVQQPIADEDAVATAVQATVIAQAVSAQLTKAASEGQQPPEQAQQPEQPEQQPAEPATDTPTPTLSATPSQTPTSTFTPTSSVPMVSVSTNTNCRIGPGKPYELLGALLVGEEAEVIARDPSNQYWYIKNPDKGGFCWLWGYYATTKGDVGSLPVFTPPPTPTFTPTPTPSINFNVVFREVDGCVGWQIEFRITNNGEVIFQSVSTTVTDNDTPETVNSQSDMFEELNGCLVGVTYQDLDPGDTGFTNSGAFFNDPTGHSVDATIKLCTENGLGGTCLTKNLSFTP
ncbi:MAG: hypothetical protein ISR58_22230 [Anaerolineales bacterium]|nr:hypothetical protein [Chloroflexota bacterium]MBL6983913.1 hypothetical protein [Anaerolineales bacterium]